MKYRVSFEFRLTRRASWPRNGTDFYDHVGAVEQKIASHEFVSDVRIITDLAESSLTVDFALDAHSHVEVTSDALRLVREAIESAGARHYGMATVGLGMMVGAGASPGVDTPIWHKRRVIIDIAA
jgi:hypothetical protein